MPTSMPRCQVLMRPEVFAQMKTLALYDRRTLSAMCAELIESALSLPRYQRMLEDAIDTTGEIEALPDPRKARRQQQMRSRISEKERKQAIETLSIEPIDEDPIDTVLKEQEAKGVPSVAEIDGDALKQLQQLLGALEKLKA